MRNRKPRDYGLRQAIEAAGSISELARRLGISQPSVSCWQRVPSERVIEVEAVTRVSRRTLRPDLFAVPEPDMRVAYDSPGSSSRTVTMRAR